jgi:hypothetical protein
LTQFQTIADSLLVSSKKRSSSSATLSDENDLAKYRVDRFMSDKTININATLALAPNHNAAAETLKLAAERRMQAELLTFGNGFGHPKTGTT